MTSEQDDDAGQVDKAEVTGQMTLVTHGQPSEIAQSGKLSLDLPVSL
jgi:hypothetical protein